MLHLTMICDDHPTLQFAARELERHLGMAFPQARFGPGGKRIALLSRDREELEDQYAVEITSQGGSITGSNCRSVLLGVYDYLRRLGFRFLTPKDTYVPQNLGEEQLSLQFSQKAAYRHRGVCIEGADSVENVLDFIDWLPKLGFNSFFLQFGEPWFFLDRWYSHVNNPTLPREEKDQAFYQHCYRKIRQAMALRSLVTHLAGHGFTAQALGYPSLGWVEDGRAPGPEALPLMALVNGRRELTDGVPLNTNLCLSNPAAVEKLCRCVVDYALAHPEAEYIHVWLADAMNRVCECDACRREQPTDQYVRLLNRLDERLEEEGLSCRIVFLLYQELLYPPEQERLRRPDRFTLMFAPISRTFQESYPRHWEPLPLPGYVRNRMTLPGGIRENLSFLHEWQQRFSGDSFVYDYPLGKAHYGDFGYQNISRVIAGDIPRLRELGLNGYISCQELRAFFPTGLPNYVMGRALVEGSVDFEGICREYLQAAFGPDWELAQAYLEGISFHSSLDYFVGKGPRQDGAAASRYRAMETFAQGLGTTLEAAWERAREGKGSNAAVQLGFWKRLRTHREYCILLSRAIQSLARGEEAGLRYDDFCRLIWEQESSLQPYLDVYRVQEIAGKYTGFQRESIFTKE